MGILGSTDTSALTLQAPSEVTFKEPFTITIEHNDSATADIKLFVQSHALQNLSKLIIDGAEKSTFYYLKEAYPTQTSFTLKIVQTASSLELCARLRKTGKIAFEEACQPLTLKEAVVSDEDESASAITEDDAPQEKDKEQEKENTSVKQNAPSFTPFTVQATRTNIPEEQTPIRLVSSSQTPAIDTSILWKVGAFTLFCIVILILLVLGKI